jgi:hypothetical protein
LQLVAAMLRLQAGDDPHLGQRLQEALKQDHGDRARS